MQSITVASQVSITVVYIHRWVCTVDECQKKWEKNVSALESAS